MCLYKRAGSDFIYIMKCWHTHQKAHFFSFNRCNTIQITFARLGIHIIFFNKRNKLSNQFPPETKFAVFHIFMHIFM